MIIFILTCSFSQSSLFCIEHIIKLDSFDLHTALVYLSLGYYISDFFPSARTEHNFIAPSEVILWSSTNRIFVESELLFKERLAVSDDDDICIEEI